MSAGWTDEARIFTNSSPGLGEGIGISWMLSSGADEPEREIRRAFMIRKLLGCL
jgi:hypothetical protein